MAIDHVRDFVMLGTETDPMANPNITLGAFLTRWITHFCAPVFVLLAGVSADLMASPKAQASSRGSCSPAACGWSLSKSSFFAFYVAHFLLIHILSVALRLVQGFEVRQMMPVLLIHPEGYGVGLPEVYVVWALVVLTLYPFCRWFTNLKARRRDWWLSYL